MMPQKKIYLAIAVILLVAAIAFFFIDRNNSGTNPLNNFKWKDITVFEDYNIEILSFLKEKNRDQLFNDNKIEFVNNIRELSVSFEKYPVVNVMPDNPEIDSNPFTNVLSDLRANISKPFLKDKAVLNKKISPAMPVTSEEIAGAWFSMEMEGINSTPGTFYVFALMKDGDQYFLLSAVTNIAYKDTYEDTFIKMVNSFHRKNPQ
jgi:hypothetical protein